MRHTAILALLLLHPAAARARTLATLDTPGYAQSVAVEGRRAYVADGDAGLLIVDVSHPESPTPLGRLALPGFAWDVAVEGSHAFVAGGSSGVHVIDVGDPRNPREIAV